MFLLKFLDKYAAYVALLPQRSESGGQREPELIRLDRDNFAVQLLHQLQVNPPTD
jgi:hypothetical protein